MKKFLSLALAALAVTSAWAEEAVFNFETRPGMNAMGLAYSTSNVKLTNPIVVGDVTLAPQTEQVFVGYDDDENYHFLLLNAGTAALGVQSVKLSVPEGYVIKGVDIYLDTDAQLNKLTFDSGNWEEDSRQAVAPGNYNRTEWHCVWTGETQDLVVSTKGAGVVPGGSTQKTYRTLLDAITVTYEEAPSTGVEGIEAGQEVKNVLYYNLAGAQSATPFDGVNIVVKEMADGSRTTTKVIL